MTKDNVKLAVIANDISYIKKSIDRIETKLKVEYVTRVEFAPIKKVVYTVVMTILLAVVGGLLAFVIK